MNQIPPASDNLFLRCYAAWRAHSTKLTGRLLLLALTPLIAVMLLLGIAKIQLQIDVAAQADSIGNELARQIAASVADPLAADDQLSLNIQLAQWNRNPLISHVQLFTAQDRLIAEAGNEPGRGKVAPGQGQFNATVHFQEAMVGQVQLHLAAEPFVAPSNTLLWRLLWGALILALVTGIIAWRMGSSLRQTLRELGHWYGDSGQPTPGARRQDELGDLARTLEKRRIIDLPPEPEPEPEPAPEQESEPQTKDSGESKPNAEHAAEDVAGTPEEDAESPEALSSPGQSDDDEAAGAARATAIDRDHPLPAGPADGTEDLPSTLAGEGAPPESEPEPDSESDSTAVAKPAAAKPESAILAVRLGNQEALRRLARPRLMAVLERYREQLQRACELYNGHLHTLHDGTSLLLFHARECRQDELSHALCCGELLRVLGHELQVEIADTGITLHLQLAIGHTADLRAVTDAELAERAECLSVLEVVQHSRNLLLLNAELADSEALKERGVVRRLASQPGIYCIERLHGPYQAMLERQLTHFYHQRPN